MTLGYLGGPCVITRVLMRGKQEGRSLKRIRKQRLEGCSLKMDEGAISRGI